ncbi:serine hydrolase domain-containing protein [Neptunitalea lumnitzerae]|uniref:Beta-lactamase-related domain-containing protein n=1 Tax=Neptunitalea lumnitzerae TaxID=2965509 RepID=A0ABQ5ML31_9FLAO|nr:serine hydrolase domain-containing protein [Neptunitalea sp. Y10]GLB50099.1 hypothetical protein Y10_24670 [Neptunitalea sp. Y10]
MKSISATITLLFLSFLTYGQQSALLNELKNKYEPYYQATHIKMGILLKQNDHFLATRLNFDNDRNTVFNIGSATKTFTAILILQEVERGTLKLSDSIGKFLSPIQNISGSLSVEQLLRHETGLAETVGNQEWDAYHIPTDSILRADVLQNVKPQNKKQIGHFVYTNTNYILLGQILEKINDQSYFDLLKNRIFTPCGLKNTYPYVSKSITNLVHPTDELNEQDQYQGINYKFFADYAFAAGSIASNLEDMALFYEHLYKKQTLISQKSLLQMTNFKNGKYGLGLQKLTIDETEYWGHGGNNYGYAFRNFYNPQTGDMILYFINRFRVPMKNSLNKDLKAILNHQSIPKFRTYKTKEFKDFIGEYVLDGLNIKFSIFEKENFIYFQMQHLKVPLVSYEPNVLLDVSSGIKFMKSSENPNQLIWFQNRKKLMAKKTLLNID